MNKIRYWGGIKNSKYIKSIYLAKILSFVIQNLIQYIH